MFQRLTGDAPYSEQRQGTFAVREVSVSTPERRCPLFGAVCGVVCGAVCGFRRLNGDAPYSEPVVQASDGRTAMAFQRLNGDAPYSERE